MENMRISIDRTQGEIIHPVGTANLRLGLWSAVCRRYCDALRLSVDVGNS